MYEEVKEGNQIKINYTRHQIQLRVKMESNSTTTTEGSLAVTSHYMFPLFIILGHMLSKHIKTREKLGIPNLFGVFMITSFYCEVLISWDLSFGILNFVAIICYTLCIHLLLYFSLRENVE